MTRNDYVLIASAFRTMSDHRAVPAQYADEGIYELACELADNLAQDNPRFDRRRFLDAALSGNPYHKGGAR